MASTHCNAAMFVSSPACHSSFCKRKYIVEKQMRNEEKSYIDRSEACEGGIDAVFAMRFRVKSKKISAIYFRNVTSFASPDDHASMIHPMDQQKHKPKNCLQSR
jgi:hypothetical protein